MQFEKDLESEFRELFLSTRQFLLSFEGIMETKKTRITTYSDKNGGICHMRTMEHGIDIGFLKGVHMEDQYRLLTGSGKVMRILSMQELNIPQVRYYVDQAIAINASKS